MEELVLFSEEGILEIGQLVLDNLSHCLVVVDGKVHRKEIYRKSIDGNEIKVYVMLDDTVIGNIESISIISVKGTEVLKEKVDIKKGTDKGLLKSFPMKIIENYQRSEVR